MKLIFILTRIWSLFLRYGHTRVQAPSNKSDPLNKLSKWVHNQRTHYWMYIKGEKSCMNEERIEELEALGFEWRVKPGRAKKGGDTIELQSPLAQSQETIDIVLPRLPSPKEDNDDTPNNEESRQELAEAPTTTGSINE